MDVKAIPIADWFCRLGLSNSPTASLQKSKTSPPHNECPEAQSVPAILKL